MLWLCWYLLWVCPCPCPLLLSLKTSSFVSVHDGWPVPVSNNSGEMIPVLMTLAIQDGSHKQRGNHTMCGTHGLTWPQNDWWTSLSIYVAFSEKNTNPEDESLLKALIVAAKVRRSIYKRRRPKWDFFLKVSGSRVPNLFQRGLTLTPRSFLGPKAHILTSWASFLLSLTACQLKMNFVNFFRQFSFKQAQKAR